LIQRVETLADLDLAQWDALLGPGDFHLSLDWLLCAEATATAPPVYLCGRDADSGELLAGLACYLLDRDAPLPFCRLDRVLDRTGLVPERVRGAVVPSLFCGGRNPAHTRVAAAADRARAEVVDAAVELGEELARSTTFLYVDEDDEALRELLRRHGFASFHTGTASALDVPAGGLDDYLARFRSDRRSAIRREVRAVREAGFELGVEPLTESLAGELLPLDLSVVRKYGGEWSPEEVEAEYAPLLRFLAPRAAVVTARLRGRLGGFLLLLHWHDELYARNVGFDYELQGRVPLYFSVVFYEPIAYAARAGAARIDYLIGSEKVKRSRGCRQLAQLGYVKCADPRVQRELAGRLAPPRTS
jgi:predicted N-acyltransferase